MTSGATDQARILIVEDNPVSQLFLSGALESLPAHVDVVPTGRLALQACAQANGHYDLWLIDLHLPDGDGRGLVKKLKAIEPTTKAIGHTAWSETAAEIDADFDAIVHKPLSADRLRDVVQEHLNVANPSSSLPCQKVWDDRKGLAALHGRKDHLDTLRQLFMKELSQTKEWIIQAMTQRDRSSLQKLLHQLQASCGFVGAHQLGLATRQLRQDPDNSRAQHLLITAIQQTQWTGIPAAKQADDLSASTPDPLQ